MLLPALTAPPSGPNFSIDVPPDWYAIVSAVSSNSELYATPVAALS
jgi:hypothetical protein